MPPIRKSYFLILLYVTLVTPGYTLPEDDKEIIHITADSSQFDYKKGISTYEGNVKIDQGTTHLLADKVTTINNDQHKIKEAIAYGTLKQAIYSTQPKIDDSLLEAKADL